MTKPTGSGSTTWWAKSLNDVDREIARLATLCDVQLLDPGVIERVLNNDASACGSNNPAAFTKMRSMLMMHYAIREKAVAALGEVQTRTVLEEIVTRLRKNFGKRIGGDQLFEKS